MTNCPTRPLGVKLSYDHCLYAAIKRYGLANVNEFKVTLGIVFADNVSEQAVPSCYRLKIFWSCCWTILQLIWIPSRVDFPEIKPSNLVQPPPPVTAKTDVWKTTKLQNQIWSQFIPPSQSWQGTWKQMLLFCIWIVPFPMTMWRFHTLTSKRKSKRTWEWGQICQSSKLPKQWALVKPILLLSNCCQVVVKLSAVTRLSSKHNWLCSG